MRERGPTLIAVVLLCALVVGTWWAADYAQRAIPIDPPARVTHEPDSWATDFVMIQTDPQGIPRNRLEGVTLRHYPDDDSYEVDDVRAVGQQPEAPVTIATGQLARMDENSTRITINGDAHVKRLPDDQHAPLDVTSQQLVIYPQTDVVETRFPARVVHGNHTMNGIGMRYNNQTQQLKVFAASDVKVSGQDLPSRSSPARNSSAQEAQP